MGRYQSNKGGGEELSETGHVEHNSGAGKPLGGSRDSMGAQQGTNPSGQSIIGSGGFAKQPKKPMVKRPLTAKKPGELSPAVAARWDKFKKKFKQETGRDIETLEDLAKAQQEMTNKANGETPQN